jgi:hypothetical protein
VEKTPMYSFSTFGSKINEFERKKSEKNEKIPKTQKLQAITLRCNSHSNSNISHGKSK